MESHTLRKVYEHVFGKVPRGTCGDSHEVKETCAVGEGTVLGIRPDEMRACAAVILDKPVEDENGARLSDVWTGWIASPYSEYASLWDIIYENHDARFKMVHTWNIVTVCSHDATVLGKIDSECLQQIRRVFSNFIVGLDESEAAQHDESEDVSSAVVTGTPIEGKDDPRLVFLEIYHNLANELGRKAMESAEDENRLSAPMTKARYKPHKRRGNVFSMALAAAETGDVVAEKFAPESKYPSFEWENYVETPQGVFAFAYDDLGIHVHLMDVDEEADTLLIEGDGQSSRFALVKSRIHEGLYLVEGMRKEEIEKFLTDGYRISWEMLGKESS